MLGLGSVALAALLDATVAEPPTRIHPVVWLGRAVDALDRDWSRPRAAGALIALSFPLLAAAAAALSVGAARSAHPVLGAALAGAVLFSATSARLLLDTAGDVNRLTEIDADAARRELRALAGRDASTLSPAQVRSAAAESLAENLADGLVAPLLAFAVCAPFSLPLAAGAAVWIKAVNTLDSMLGYPSKPHGGASARLDDAVMWLPARTSAALIALAGATLAAPRTARPWARVPASPNSGWPMATLAVVLGARFEKPGHYVLNPDARLPDAGDVERGVRVVGRACVLTYAASGTLVAVAVAAGAGAGAGVSAWF